MRIKIRIREVDDFHNDCFPFLGLFISLLIIGIAFMGGGTITNLLSEKVKNVDYQELIHSPQYQHMSLDEIIDKFHNEAFVLKTVSITLFSIGVFVFLVIFGLLVWLRFNKKNQSIILFKKT